MNIIHNTATINSTLDHWDKISKKMEKLNTSEWVVRQASKMGYNHGEKRVEANFFHVNRIMAQNLYETFEKYSNRKYVFSNELTVRRYGHGNLNVNTNISWKLPKKHRKTTITISPYGLSNLRLWRKNQEDGLLKIKPRLYRGKIIFDFVLAQ